MISERARQKGAGFVLDERVERLSKRQFRVQGETDTYMVFLESVEAGDVKGSCSCPAGEHGFLCSHLWAAAIVSSL